MWVLPKLLGLVFKLGREWLDSARSLAASRSRKLSTQLQMTYHLEVNFEKQLLKVNLSFPEVFRGGSMRADRTHLVIFEGIPNFYEPPSPFYYLSLCLQGQWRSRADSRLLSEFAFSDDGLPCQFKRHRINLFQWFLFRLNASRFSIFPLALQKNNHPPPK